jgi:uncharacterized membrane protein
MDKVRSQAAVIGTALLGVIAICAVVVGVFLLFGAWTMWRGEVTSSLDEVGVAGAVMLGVLSIAFGAMAAAASYEEWVGRAVGRMLGLIVAVVVVLAAVVTLLVANIDSATEPLFYVLGGLGIVTAIPLLVPDRMARTTA